MRLCLTNNSPSLDTLSHLPPLPLIIDYSDGTRTMARKDEDNVRLGLRQHGQLVRRLALWAPSSSLRILLEPMNKRFPRLEDLSLLSTTTDELSLVLPETFQAPRLRRLSLDGIGLPKGLLLLSSAIALSTLSLTHIQDSSYLFSGHLVTQLQGLPYIEELSIGFAIAIPPPGSEREPLPPPIPPVTLPTLRLRRLTFWGEDVYLNNFVAQINTPLLERLSLTLFFDPTFDLWNLTEFIRRTEGFECLVARVIFNKDSVSIDAGNYEQQGIGKFSLHVNCESIDWQIDSATQVCSALGNILSAVEELTLALDEDGMPSDWEDTLNNMVWHELLLPFIGVKKLHIGFSLALELSRSLGSVAGGLALEFLPELQELGVQFEINHAKTLFCLFIENRESLGLPIHLLALPIPYTGPMVFPKYMNYVSPTPVRCDVVTYLTGSANIDIASGPLATNV
jgi:hypothetical protein